MCFTLYRKRFALALGALLSCLGLAAQGQTPNWPDRMVRLVVGFPPGGIVDLVARQLQPHLQQALARIFHEQEDYQLFLLLAEFWQIGLI